MFNVTAFMAESVCKCKLSISLTFLAQGLTVLCTYIYYAYYIVMLILPIETLIHSVNVCMSS